MPAMIALAVALAGCGSSKKASTSAGAKSAAAPTILSVSISEAGKHASYVAPTSVAGGLVTMRLTNTGKSPHSAQLLRMEGGHTIEQALQVLRSEGRAKIPDWLHGEGGVGAAESGGTGTATMNLAAGSYALVDVAAAQSGEGPPAVAPLTVTAGTEGPLPATGTTITAAAPSKDHYKWQISGPLKVGSTPITFVSKGKRTIHELSVGRITADVPLSRIVKDLSSERNGPPPSYVDPTVNYQTSTIDSGKSENTSLILTKPGKYVFFCHLRDRDGGKPHFVEGLITTVTVK
jgi:hypothetical protein